MRTTAILVLAAAFAIPTDGARAAEVEITTTTATPFEITDLNRDGSVDRSDFMLREDN